MTNSKPEGFLAVPPTGKGPAILVLHAWWGLNETLKAFCKRLADSGFVAFAPDGLTSVGGYPGNEDDARKCQEQVGL